VVLESPKWREASASLSSGGVWFMSVRASEKRLVGFLVGEVWLHDRYVA
jgi:hypothetical protein